MRAPTLDVSTTGRSPTSGMARTRYGVAFPTVRAPTITPIANPRSVRNQVAVIFMAGGYTPARKNPVRNRRPRADGNPGAARIAAFAKAPNRAEMLKSRPAGITSARFRTAATAVPQTKPSWTIVVNQPASALVRPQIERSWGVPAVAEHH